MDLVVWWRLGPRCRLAFPRHPLRGRAPAASTSLTPPPPFAACVTWSPSPCVCPASLTVRGPWTTAWARHLSQRAMGCWRGRGCPWSATGTRQGCLPLARVCRWRWVFSWFGWFVGLCRPPPRPPPHLPIGFARTDLHISPIGPCLLMARCSAGCCCASADGPA